MALIFSDRHAAQSDRAVDVSPIAICGNNLSAPGSWPCETAALLAMMAEFRSDLSRGPLDARSVNDWCGASVVYCGRSFDPVQVSVHARNAADRSAGREFNRSTSGQGSLGVGQVTSTGRPDAARSRMGRLKSAEDPREQS
jgi:hypothetical protein